MGEFDITKKMLLSDEAAAVLKALDREIKLTVSTKQCKGILSFLTSSGKHCQVIMDPVNRRFVANIMIGAVSLILEMMDLSSYGKLCW